MWPSCAGSPDWDVAVTVGEGDDAKNRPAADIAIELGPKVLAEFGQQEGEINYVRRAPRNARRSGGSTGWCPGAWTSKWWS